MKKGRSDALRLIVLAILLFSLCPFAATSLQKAHAITPALVQASTTQIAGGTSGNCVLSTAVAPTDTILVFVVTNSGLPGTPTDTLSNSYLALPSASDFSGAMAGAVAGFAAVTVAGLSDTITVTFTSGAAIIACEEWSNIPNAAAASSATTGIYGSGTSYSTSTPSLTPQAGAFVYSVLAGPTCGGGASYTVPTHMTADVSSGITPTAATQCEPAVKFLVGMASSYSVSWPGGSTSQIYTMNGAGSVTEGSASWAQVSFWLNPSPNFTCIITNLDAGNYIVVGTSKAYDFQCTVASSVFSGPAFPISLMQMTFNDSVHQIVLQYNNNTINGPIGYSILSGGSYVTLGPGPVSSTLSGSTRTLVVNFMVTPNNAIVDANNRGIVLFAKNYGIVFPTFGPLTVQKNYFNIINKGGQTTVIVSGLCSIPKGADTFQTECKYQSSPKSFIEENATYSQIQAFQMQDAIKLSDGSTAQQGDALLWQNYANSGSGANNSTNPGDWTITYALYYWDNSSWVKGINAELSTLFGRQGTNNEWTAFNVEWRNGATFIKNDTIVDWIQQTPLGEATIYCNLWFSNNNQSTVQGGQVSNFYTGMHNVGYLWWSSWSPLLQNETQSEAFAPLLNHSGKLISSTTLTLAKVGYVMARPGPSAVHAKQPNFYIDTLPYQAQTFQIASGTMGGITNPSFNAAVIPIIQNTGFFSPIVNALRSLANWLISGLSAVGEAIWASLALQFPWMTNWLTLIYNTILGFYQFLFTVFAYVVQFVRFLYSIVSLVVYPITVIIGAWGYIQGIYLPIFSGANLSAMIEIAILWIFAGYIIDASERNDPAAYWKLATSAWHVTKAVFDVTWMIAKFIVDSLEGLIP